MAIFFIERLFIYRALLKLSIVSLW